MTMLAVVEICVAGIVVTVLAFFASMALVAMAERLDPSWCYLDWDRFHEDCAMRFPGPKGEAAK